MDGDDRDLALAAASGDRNAFSALMTRHQAMILRLASRMSATAAEDIAQETFVAAWRNIARFDPNQRFDIWLRAIALNKARDNARRATVRKLVAMDFSRAPEDTADASATNPETTVGDRQELARLDRAIRKLPAALRDPLVLTALEGLSHAEAGAALGVSAKSVEMSVYRARRKLADEMNLQTD